jgi:hypothetical protein
MCAERHAIQRALAENLETKREHFKALAIMGLDKSRTHEGERKRTFVHREPCGSSFI